MRKLLPLILSFLLCSTAWAGVDFTSSWIANADNDNSLDFTSGSFTICLRIKLEGTDATQDDVIAGKTLHPFSQDGYFFVQHVNSTKIDFGFYNGGYKVVNGVTSLGTTDWHFVCAEFDDSNNTLKVFVDGVEDASLASVTVNPLGNNDPFEIGCKSNATAKCINAIINDVSIYSTALGVTNIDFINDAKTRYVPIQVSTSSLKAYAPLDECVDGATCSGADQFNDRSGNSQHFTASNSPTGKAEEVLSYP